MKYIVTMSRIPLGLIFVIFGLNGFLHFIPTPQFPGLPAQFLGAIFASHFYIVVFLTQIVGGLLMLANRCVPFGVLLLGPVLVNILSFHIFMSSTNLPIALVATALWCIMFYQVRSAFSGVLVRKFPEDVRWVPQAVWRSRRDRLRKAQLRFRNEIVTGPGGSEILLDDPSGNPVELFQPSH